PVPDRSGALDSVVVRAREGDGAALETLVRAIKDDVYGLAIRMLWHPEDAEDATQEILLKVVTHLGSFRGESAFRTWVYRIATNHLLGIRKSRVEREELSFEVFADQLAAGLSGALEVPPDADQALLEEEVKIGCTQGMLLCLDREHRLAYILGEVFELAGDEAARVLDIEPAAFRKRLSRARSRIRGFMRGHCGLVNRDNPCRCARRIPHARETGRLDPGHLLFATHPSRGDRPPDLNRQVQEMEELHRAAAVFRSHPDYAGPERLLDAVRKLVESGRQSMLRQ
ncbi:MAG: RNA polymerase sigma factor, partial [Gemmatimonadales bacterium]